MSIQAMRDWSKKKKEWSSAPVESMEVLREKLNLMPSL